MIKFLFIIGLLHSLAFPQEVQSEEKLVPRTILVLYDKQFQKHVLYLDAHVFAEMPLNHLGFYLHYHDIREGLPPLYDDPDIAAVLLSFPDFTFLENPEPFIDWALKMMNANKKFLVLGRFMIKSGEEVLSSSLMNPFWKSFGLYDTGSRVEKTYDTQILYQDPRLTAFERGFTGIKASYNVMQVISKSVKSYLIAQSGHDSGTRSTLVAIGPKGGYISPQYMQYNLQPSEYLNVIKQWTINLFLFFRLALDVGLRPIPDATTMAGRRIFYNQIDGDGWNSLTELEKYKTDPTSCAEALYREILLKFPHLPVTVAPIAADVALNWYGTPQNRDIAKKMFELPQVEKGCHTFTHPFNWKFFEEYTPEKEVPYLSKYPLGSWKKFNFLERFLKFLSTEKKEIYNADIKVEISAEDQTKDNPTLDSYPIPRAYALQPFNLELEVLGAIDVINQLGPPGKSVSIYQWSGDCDPFPAAIEMVYKAGVKNINGSDDTRFDQSHNSYAWVAPLGREIAGKYFQIYASNSNENTYTDLWRNKFYAFNESIQTYKNTETPLRVKPLDLYYHVYSLEKQASLNALLDNFAFIQQQDLIPLHTSHYVSIVEGVNQANIRQIADKAWKISNRGELQTVRFDQSTFYTVDFNQSKGIVGQRHFQGSLYVYLDQVETEPLITLKETETFFEEPMQEVPYLIQSKWRVWDLKRISKENWEFTTQGFGEGNMEWKIPQPGTYQVSIVLTDTSTKDLKIQSQGHLLPISLEDIAIQPCSIRISKDEP